MTTTRVAGAEPWLVTETVNVATLPTVVRGRASTVWLTEASGAAWLCHDGAESLVGANATAAASLPSEFASQTSLPRRNAILLPSGEKAARVVAGARRDQLGLAAAARPSSSRSRRPPCDSR